MSDWADMSELEKVAKAIRDTEWLFIRATYGGPPSQAYADTLPLTRMNLAAADAAIKALDLARRQE